MLYINTMFGSDKRKNRRYPSIARVQVPGAFPGDALLKDISVTGCRIECTMDVDLQAGCRYRIILFPEKTSGIGSFDLMADCKWVYPGTCSCDIGFDIKESPRGKAFQRYVDYLAWRDS